MKSIRAYSTYPTHLVGESNYKKMIDEIYNAPNRYLRNNAVFADALILLEDDNAYDKNAVVVIVNKSIMGYLSKDDAKIFRRTFAKFADQAQFESRVRIYQGSNNYSVKLDVNLIDKEMNLIEDVKTKATVLPQLKETSTNDSLLWKIFKVPIIIFVSVLILIFIFG